MESPRRYVQVVTGVVVTVFAAGILLSGGKVQAEWLKFYSVAVLVASGLVLIWDRWMWRLRPVQRFGRVPPAVRATWKGTLTSLWVDPATGTPPPSKTVYLVVRQTATSVSVVMLSDEGQSSSTHGRVSRSNGSPYLDYLYVSDPDLSTAHRNPMHRGAASLMISGAPAKRLRGPYWTSRRSIGELELNERSPALASDLIQAQALFP